MNLLYHIRFSEYMLNNNLNALVSPNKNVVDDFVKFAIKFV